MNMRNLALLGVVLFLLIALVTVMTTSGGAAQATEITYSEFQKQVDTGHVKDLVTIKGNRVTTTIDSKKVFVVRDQISFDFSDKLAAKGVNVKIEDTDSGGTILGYVFSALPLLFIVGLWFFLMRQMQGG